jgi:hypothetical protein
MSYSHTPALTGITGLFDENGNSEINVVKMKKISITAPANAAETTVSGTWALPANALVVRALFKVTTAEATGTTKTVNIGTKSSTGGDADGLLAAGNVSATGVLIGAGALIGTYVTSNDVITITAGSADFVELAGTLYIFYIEV